MTFILLRYYVSQTSLLPALSSTPSSALGSLGNLGALASLVGVNFSAGKDQSVEAITLLKPRHFTLAFICDHGLLPALSPRKWGALPLCTPVTTIIHNFAIAIAAVGRSSESMGLSMDRVQEDTNPRLRDLAGAVASSKPAPPLDLVRVVRTLCSRRWWIAGVSMLFALLGLAYASIATPSYKAQAVLLQRDENASFGLSSAISQFSGLANLAGINLGADEGREPLGVLRSKGFARRFIAQNELTPLFAKETTGSLLSGAPSPDESTKLRQATEVFTRTVLDVSEDRRAGLVIVTVRWKDPYIAAKWANLLVAQVNNEMRLRALEDSERNIQYLNEQLQRTDIVSAQQAIARVLESEMQRQMLAQGTTEYAYRVIDAADPPAFRDRPKRLLVVVFAFVAGLIFSVASALLVDPVRQLFRAARADR